MQSVLFDKNMYDLKNAIIWMKKHRFNFMKIHDTKNLIRFILIPPNLLRMRGFTHFRTKRFNNYIKVFMLFKDYWYLLIQIQFL